MGTGPGRERPLRRDGDSSPTFALRSIERLVGAADEGLVFFVRLGFGDADGEAGGAEPEGAVLVLDAVHDDPGLVFVGIGQDQDEFVAAVAVGGIDIFADAYLDDVGQRLERMVAHLVAFGIVELLEMVDVDHDKGQLAARIAFEAGKLALDLLIKIARVVKPGQAVGNGQLAEELVLFQELHLQPFSVR